MVNNLEMKKMKPTWELGKQWRRERKGKERKRKETFLNLEEPPSHCWSMRFKNFIYKKKEEDSEETNTKEKEKKKKEWKALKKKKEYIYTWFEGWMCRWNFKQLKKKHTESAEAPITIRNHNLYGILIIINFWASKIFCFQQQMNIYIWDFRNEEFKIKPRRKLKTERER